MKIVMFKNGDGALQFTDQEVKILSKKKELIFPLEAMHSFANQLVHIGFAMVDKIPVEKQNKSVSNFGHIAGKDEIKSE
tara:strand:- start:960 stop:1196 length:237 start_codon:yes stop_codon:yes gene_type:complete